MKRLTTPQPAADGLALGGGGVVTRDRTLGVVGQTMGLVALTVGWAALGAYAGRRRDRGVRGRPRRVRLRDAA